MEGLLKNEKYIKIYCQESIFFQDSSIHTSSPSPTSSYFLNSAWWIRFLISVPAEGNKELCFWSDGLIWTLTKCCKPVIPFSCYPAFARPVIQTVSHSLLPADRSPLDRAAAWLHFTSHSPHQRLDWSDLLAHCCPGSAGREVRCAVIQNIIWCFDVFDDVLKGFLVFFFCSSTVVVGGLGFQNLKLTK